MTDDQTTELAIIIEALTALASAITWTVPNSAPSVESYLKDAWAAIDKLIDNDTRWYELFGTPERTARTLQYVLACKDSRPWVACEECPILGGCAVRSDGHDALLEWLRGDA